MTYQGDFTLSGELLEQITAQGFEFLPELIRILLNAAMKAERQHYLGAAPYQHSPERIGHANGYKPKTMATRLGEITFQVPQVREGGFYPNALERLSREIHRRSCVVSIFPNEAACLRLISAVLVEQDEEWQVHGRVYLTIQEGGSPPSQS